MAVFTATLTSGAYTIGNANATAGYYISYLTPTDADGIALAHGGVELKWNGVPYSTQNIQEGKYTFWVYEHVFYNAATATANGLAKQFADALANQIKTVDASVAGIFLDTVQVSRQAEGALVTPNYF